MKKLFLIITLLAAMLLSAATALAAAPSVVDQAKVLKPAELKQLQLTLNNYEKQYGVRMAVVIIPTIGAQQPGVYANKLIDNVYNDGANGNVVLLQVTQSRKWYISTDKKMKSVIVGNEGIEYISKPMVAKLQKNDALGAYTTYADKTAELLKYYKANGKGWAPENHDSTYGSIAGVVIAAIAAFFRRSSLKASMSNLRYQTEADTYLNKNSFNLEHSEDIYLYSTTHVVPRPKTNNNSRDGSVTDNHSDGNHGGGGGSY